jgi:hypothetical protein
MLSVRIRSDIFHHILLVNGKIRYDFLVDVMKTCGKCKLILHSFLNSTKSGQVHTPEDFPG